MEHLDQVLKFLTTTAEEKDYSGTCVYCNHCEPCLHCGHCESRCHFGVKQQRRMEKIE